MAKGDDHHACLVSGSRTKSNVAGQVDEAWVGAEYGTRECEVTVEKTTDPNTTHVIDGNIELQAS
jgi:hypothetical protein